MSEKIKKKCLKKDIKKFLEKETLNSNELKELKWFVIFWIDRVKEDTILDFNPEIDQMFIDHINLLCDLSKKVISLNQSELSSFVSNDLLDVGIDLF